MSSSFYPTARLPESNGRTICIALVLFSCQPKLKGGWVFIVLVLSLCQTNVPPATKVKGLCDLYYYSVLVFFTNASLSKSKGCKIYDVFVLYHCQTTSSLQLPKLKGCMIYTVQKGLYDLYRHQRAVRFIPSSKGCRIYTVLKGLYDLYRPERAVRFIPS